MSAHLRPFHFYSIFLLSVSSPRHQDMNVSHMNICIKCSYLPFFELCLNTGKKHKVVLNEALIYLFSVACLMQYHGWPPGAARDPVLQNLVWAKCLLNEVICHSRGFPHIGVGFCSKKTVHV